MNRTIRLQFRLTGLLVTILVVMAGLLRPALADTTYYPSPDNGQKVYLSRSCHDRSSGACIDNPGCDGFSENSRSALLAYDALRGPNLGSGLLDRQYIVRIGDGLTAENIRASNGWNAKMHIPLHSNAKNNVCDSPVNSDAYGGTHMLYTSTNGRQLSAQMVYALDSSSPGTDDRVIERNDLGELNDTSAVASYAESEYHTWNKGVNWLRESESWAYLIGYGVDRCRGYPRRGEGTTGEKRCDW